MAIENELKMVLTKDFSAATLSGWKHIHLRQGYLPDGPRLRQEGASFAFNYKRWIPAKNALIEIETAIGQDDFDALWPDCENMLEKDRYVRHLDGNEWVVDFFHARDGAVYFVMAEVEMPEGMDQPISVPEELEGHILHRAARNDGDYTSKKLANPDHARMLYARLTR